MKPYGLTTFCDDVRTEDSGKNIYIGVYEDSLLLNSHAPVILPTFTMIIKVLEPIVDRGSDFNVKVYAPGGTGQEVIFDIDLPKDRWAIIDRPEFDPDAHFVGSVLVVKANGFIIPNLGYIKVRGYRGDEEFRLGSLRVGSNVL